MVLSGEAVGTTTASVFATVHAHSVDAFFSAAEAKGLRMLCGKVLMDRHCPDNLRDSAASGHADSQALIERWHGRGRLGYSLTPRFAPTSTREQLQATGELFSARPDLHLQTHLAENPAEIAWVQALFPERSSYLDVYAHYGLLGPRSIYGHCIHLSPAERADMAAAGAAATTHRLRQDGVGQIPIGENAAGVRDLDLATVATVAARAAIGVAQGDVRKIPCLLTTILQTFLCPIL